MPFGNFDYLRQQLNLPDDATEDELDARLWEVAQGLAPTFPRIPMIKIKSAEQFKQRSRFAPQEVIQLDIIITLIHEIAHSMEMQKDSSAHWGVQPIMVPHSESLALVEEVLRSPSFLRLYRTALMQSAEDAEYISLPSEIWARAFTQYIATKLREKQERGENLGPLKGLLRHLRLYDGDSHWEPEEFRSIAPLVEAVINKFPTYQ